MNTQIKFRCWNTTHKEMNSDSYAKLILYKESVGENILDCKVLRFTGFTDKNNVEIYEGDILKKNYGSSVPLCVAAYHKERGMFTQQDGYNEPLFELPKEYIEIIGNIYENPKLLKIQNETKD